MHLLKRHLDALKKVRSDLPPESRLSISQGIRPRPRLNIWQWAQQGVDYSLSPNYDTPMKGSYSIEWMPFWKKPVEDMTNLTVKQVAVWKCSRAGGTENLLLNAIRYCVAVRPMPVMYLAGNQDNAEGMMRKRIIRGLRCCRETNRHLNWAIKQGTLTQQEIGFAHMDLKCTFPRNRTAFKGDGYGMILCDEVSLFPDFSADMIRRRTVTYPFPHIAFVSSADPTINRESKDDPIIMEWEDGNRCEWQCDLNETGTQFTWKMGARGGEGVQWDEGARRSDGTYDFDRVKETAHYRCANGATILEHERLQVSNAGDWLPTNPAAPEWKTSYRISAFMTPFDSFGDIAVAFLKAQGAQGAHQKIRMKTFVYEFLAEHWQSDDEIVEAKQLHGRIQNYARGSIPADDPDAMVTVMTVDVQKAHFWFVVRAWCLETGRSWLIDWGRVMSWDDLDAIAEKYEPPHVLVDSGYRTPEVYAECIERQMIPTKGDDKSRSGVLPWSRTYISPTEGMRRVNRGAQLELITWHVDTCKLMLSDRVKGEVAGWYVPQNIDREYVTQMTSEKRTETGWQQTHRDNHLWDCEAAQILAAIMYDYIRYDRGEIGQGTA